MKTVVRKRCVSVIGKGQRVRMDVRDIERMNAARAKETKKGFTLYPAGDWTPGMVERHLEVFSIL